MRTKSHISNLILATLLAHGYGQASAQSLDQPLNYISPVTLSNDDLADGGQAFRIIFENITWQGDLRSYTYTNNSGVITSTSGWSARTVFADAETNNQVGQSDS